MMLISSGDPTTRTVDVRCTS
ncbi:hypothetical protein Patl1_31868 [Pistacia atlantica]|uniref:Uncharacterized protein n=1 Tax=Pistacia atlantica TaxID=434234 RepID=A0ACC1AQX6_9ROSI|nr:hypothetical protein Patl1_31868 [Pistacia atlantica]